jgi:outer membrane protein assembly factor BamC
MKAHGRAAELSVALKDYLETRNGEIKDDIDAIAKRREETNILNQVISFYEYNLRLEDSRRLSKIKQGVATALGFNADGEPALVVSEKYDVVWPRLLLVLKKLGFDVKDIDKSAGLMFVNYSGGDASWWSGLFSSDDRFVKEGAYRLKVGKLGDKSAVTFMDDESKAFTPDQVADIFETFATVMADDNLDI